MSVLILLIAAGGTVASGFLAAFVWAVRSGQFDDTWTPAVRVLLDARTAGTGERDALPTAITPESPARACIRDTEPQAGSSQTTRTHAEPYVHRPY